MSHEGKKKQTVHDERVSYVFTGSTAVKFVNVYIHGEPATIFIMALLLGKIAAS